MFRYVLYTWLTCTLVFAVNSAEALDSDSLRQKISSFGFTPIEPYENLNADKVKLGKRLFFEPRISSNGQVSCASCHVIAEGGDDGRQYSVGVSGRPSSVNSPSVLFAGMQFAQFWDGRAKTLERQIDGPLEHPDEMGSDWRSIVATLSADPAYLQLFEDVYKGGNKKIEPAQVRDAIAEFERSLVRSDSRFDDYLRGEEGALTAEEKAGFALFIDVGCASCHQGPLLGGNLYQKMGILNNYFDDRGNITQADYGRYNVSGNELDRYVFKVPSLRGVAETAPFLHDGAVQTLEDAVDTMTYYQLGLELSPEENRSIVAFLKTLSPRPLDGLLADGAE